MGPRVMLRALFAFLAVVLVFAAAIWLAYALGAPGWVYPLLIILYPITWAIAATAIRMRAGD
jgi:hypothetical protein